MQNFIQNGNVLDYTVPTGGVKSGDVVIAGALVGVAVSTGAKDDVVAVNLTGVYELPKATGAITVGALVYWSTTNKNVSTTAAENTLIGKAFAPAISADAVVLVRLSN